MSQTQITFLALMAMQAFSTVSLSQNLVPNSSFEEVSIDYCGFPTREMFEKVVVNWVIPTQSRPIIRSSKLDTGCWSFINVHQPRTGSRVGSFLAYARRNQRSYFEVALKEPLTIGKRYHTQFFVRIRKGSEFACNNIGLAFSDSLVRERGYSVLKLVPQVVHAEIPSDIERWIELRGSFISMSKSKYLIIGNFFSNEETLTTTLRTTATEEVFVFYLIDDVYVGEEIPDIK